MGKDILNRQGSFELTRAQTVENPEFWALVMSKVLVVRCEYFWGEGLFKYMAYSPLFDKALDGERSSRYEIFKDEYNDIKAKRIVDL